VNEADGSLATCTVASGNGSFNYPEAITINSTATIAYIANSNSNLVAICPITSNGLFGACTTDSDPSFSVLDGITLSSSGDYLYASNFDSSAGGSVSICPVNLDGSLAACVDSGDMGGLLEGPQLVGISPGDATHLYSSGTADQLSMTICDISASDGSLSACIAASGSGPAPNPGFDVPEGIAFNALGTIAYIGNVGSSTTVSSYVSICPVNDGSFGACTITQGNGTFDFIQAAQIGLYISSATQIAYIPNNNNNTVSICPINLDGSLGVCTTSAGGGTFNQPDAIFLATLPAL
jgi:DNA-binding beta-propeller fold protein YncE